MGRLRSSGISKQWLCTKNRRYIFSYLATSGCPRDAFSFQVYVRWASDQISASTTDIFCRIVIKIISVCSKFQNYCLKERNIYLLLQKTHEYKTFYTTQKISSNCRKNNTHSIFCVYFGLGINVWYVSCNLNTYIITNKLEKQIASFFILFYLNF